MESDVKMRMKKVWMDKTFQTILEQFESKKIPHVDIFGEQFKEYGPTSSLVRINDSFERIKTLMLSGEKHIEGKRVEDILCELACYCLMTVYELEGLAEKT